MLFDAFDNRVILTLDLRAETALRVGSGRALEPVGTDLPVIKDATGQPFIPGSSLKGALRSRLESFVRAVRPGRRGACNPLQDTEMCLRAGEWQPGSWDDAYQVWQISPDENLRRNWRYPEGGVPEDEPVGIADLRKDLPTLPVQQRDAELADRVLLESCLVCQVFGSPWLASHVLFRDLVVDPNYWFGQYQVRDGVAINRDTETASDQKLYNFEVVPAGTRFTGQVVVENGEDWQLGLLAAGLRELAAGRLALGGATSRGLGMATVTWTGAQVTKANLLPYLATGRDGQTPVDDTMMAEWGRQFVTHLRTHLREEGGHAQTTAE